ncbi:MAG: VWA domain-containing protein [Rhodospirillales bacterium]
MAPKTEKLELTKSTSSEIDAFLDRAQTSKTGRIIFALDATQSRQPSWDRAAHLQAEMFQAVESLGSLEVQLVFYRGFGECKASNWTSNASELRRLMLRVQCMGGLTQIGKILTNALRQTGQRSVSAVIFIGDAFEENIDEVCHKAGQLGLQGTPALMFQEGQDQVAAQAFKEIARLTNGAYCPFDDLSANALKDLLSAAAVYAVGGLEALDNMSAKGSGSLRRALPSLK